MYSYESLAQPNPHMYSYANLVQPNPHMYSFASLVQPNPRCHVSLRGPMQYNLILGTMYSYEGPVQPNSRGHVFLGLQGANHVSIPVRAPCNDYSIIFMVMY